MVVVRNDPEQHSQAFRWSDFLPQFFSSLLENWQSEFLQLVWQAAGLALFTSGTPHSPRRAMIGSRRQGTDAQRRLITADSDYPAADAFHEALRGPLAPRALSSPDGRIRD